MYYVQSRKPNSKYIKTNMLSCQKASVKRLIYLVWVNLIRLVKFLVWLNYLVLFLVIYIYGLVKLFALVELFDLVKFIWSG